MLRDIYPECMVEGRPETEKGVWERTVPPRASARFACQSRFPALRLGGVARRGRCWKGGRCACVGGGRGGGGAC